MDVATLDGSQLDYWVMRALGENDDGPAGIVAHRMKQHGESFIELWDHPTLQFRPSTRWDQAGRIIDSYRIDISMSHDRRALQVHCRGISQSYVHFYPAGTTTRLVAAMRCFVASTLGPTV